MKKIKLIFTTFILGVLFFQNINAQTANDRYFELVKHYRHLLKEDKKAARAIYETQLLEAKDFYEYEIKEAVNAIEQAKWEGAYERTKEITEEVYNEEVENLENGFEKAVGRLDEKFNKARTERNSNRRSRRG